MIRIKGKVKNFRRCGIAHPAEFVEYPDDRFSKEELTILKAEPMLIVEVVKKGAPTAAEKKVAEAKAAEEEAAKAEAKRLAEEEAAKKDAEDLSLLTVAELMDEIAKYQPVGPLKKVKKTELIEILKAHREVKV